MTATKTLVQQIMTTPLITDERVLTIATQALTDYFACILTSKNELEIQQLKQWISDEGGNATSWLIGQKQAATARQAALFNGFQAHFLDYDDVHAEVRGHPSAVILSALFASINMAKTSENLTALNSQRFLTAYVIGVEIMARLGVALNPTHYNQGFHPTGTLGGIGAVAAICYLHQYDFLEQALALTATQTAGLRLMFGTPIKPLHAGLAAQSAIQTIEILKHGLTAQADFLDEKMGFMAVYGNAQSILDIQNWGQSWKIVEPGLWFKTYNFCSAAATVADAASILQPQINPDEIDKIKLQFNPKGDAALIYTQPETQVKGRFSAEYIVAKILCNEPLDAHAFTTNPIPLHIQKIMQKIDRTYGESSQRFGAVKVRLKNGEILQHCVEHPKGSPKKPYSERELYEKLANAIQNDDLSQRFFASLQTFKLESNLYHFINQYKDIL
ncbi:2-methylcitrate dehydratase PrpD [Pasteurella langaaensis DSM 22999]|uniref:2-methylcitrate dehydratase PrpD n=1 Tax=Alitibacter langaaensis DSM 22999 TaxID=1122935 RepID=A0A2U0T5D0_9PAST|nr:MmgE/PrpD family protein [Pasteurella langaaensis]PVX38795.1 2-methylcitrate dehydratase PrpD [Pasteurella langaaensis DSM 22999]